MSGSERICVSALKLLGNCAMSQKPFFGVSVACAVGLAVSAQPTSARQPVVFTYFLPTTSVSATVSHRLIRCPAVGVGDVVIVTSWSLKPVTEPDYDAPVYIDASTGFLAERSTELTFNPDGTLLSINAKSTGQGEKVINAVLDLAGTIAPMFAGGLPMGTPGIGPSGPEPSAGDERCTEEVLALLAAQDKLINDVAEGEELVRKGDANQARIDQLARDTEMLVGTKAALTVSQSAASVLGPALGGLNQSTDIDKLSGSVLIAKPDISVWFKGGYATLIAADVPGQEHGFRIEYAVSKSAARAMRSIGDAKWNPSEIGSDLVYRRPVPAQLLAYPCGSVPANGECEKDVSPRGRLSSASLEFSMPQVSKPSSIPVGSAGIFGSRTVSAEFNPNGAPLKLSYGSSPGSEGIASSIGAAGDALGEVRAARLNAIKRETELREAEEALQKYTQP